MAPGAAVSDAVSTAIMVLTEPEIAGVMSGHKEWRAFVQADGRWREAGRGGVEGLNS
jgi:hypothetical protein